MPGRAVAVLSGLAARTLRRTLGQERSLRVGIWLVPQMGVAASIGLSFATIAIDRAADYEPVPTTLTATPAGAQAILTAVATSMVTLTTLVLTLVTLAIQLAMGQFSPRIVGALMRDRPSQLSIGLFSGTFVYALLALRAVDVPPGPDAGAVPGLTILVAYALMLASLGTLVLYVAHAGRSLRPSSLIDLVGDDLHAQLARIYSTQDAGLPAATPGGSTIVATEPGVIISLDEAGLVDLASSPGCVLRTVPMIGDFVPAQGVLLEVEGDRERLDVQRAAAMVDLAAERTDHDDSARVPGPRGHRRACPGAALRGPHDRGAGHRPPP